MRPGSSRVLTAVGLTVSLLLMICAARLACTIAVGSIVGSVTDASGAVVPARLSESLKWALASRGSF